MQLFSQVSQGVNNIEQQTNSNANGDPATPPAINNLNVTANNGHFEIAINHEGPEFYRGVHYFVEHADNPHFTDAHTIHMGTTRNLSKFFGDTQRYFRAYAQYPGSPPGPIAYHGSQGMPSPVTGGGSVPGPSFAPSQGSGTNQAGEPHGGFGNIPYRTQTGKPPVR